MQKKRWRPDAIETIRVKIKHKEVASARDAVSAGTAASDYRAAIATASLAAASSTLIS